jgi:hypothetical protein
MSGLSSPEVVMKKISSVSFWVFIFIALVAIETYSTFGQSLTIRYSSILVTEKVRKTQPSNIDCFTTFTQRTAGLYGMDKSTVFMSPLRPNWISGNSCIDNRSTFLVP